MDNRSIKKLEADLWESADLLRAGSKLTSNQYCMPVLGLLFLRYAYSRFKLVEAEILKNRPMRNGRRMPVEAKDFSAKSALFLPREAQYDYLVNLPENIAAADLKNITGQPMNSLGEVVNNAMELVEQQSEQLAGVLPKSYTDFSDELLGELLRIFNNNALDEVGGDVIGRIYEYFLNKFAKNIASDDGVFFTPKSLVKMIVNMLEPTSGVLLDPACGSGGMFVQTGDFVNEAGLQANSSMTFYGQEKVEYNAQLCLMNMAVHGLTGVIKSGDEANTFYHDAHNLEGCCDYVMANPPFNVDKVKAESASNAGRLPFGCPKENKYKEIGNANYLWISYFYAYLNEKGRAGFVMASSATDSQGSDKDIREKLVKTGHVDVMISVGNNFFYTKSLPCSLWFFDKGKKEELKNKVLFIDARNYYTEVDRTLNEWSEWQLKNLNAIVWLYRGENEKYTALLYEYRNVLGSDKLFDEQVHDLTERVKKLRAEAKAAVEAADKREKKIEKTIFNFINEQLEDIDIDFLTGLGIKLKVVSMLISNGYKKLGDIEGISTKTLLHIVGDRNFVKFEGIEDELKKPLFEIFDDVLFAQSKEEDFCIDIKRACGYTLQELGNEYGLTRERIRQKIAKFNSNLDSFMKPIVALFMSPKNYITVQELLDIYDNDDYDKAILYWCKNSDDLEYLEFAEVFVYAQEERNAVENQIETIAEEFIGDGINLYDNLEELEDLMQNSGFPYMDGSSFINLIQQHGYKVYGDFVVKGRQSYGYLCARVVAEKFPNGIKIYDGYDLDKLRTYAAEEYGDLGIPDSNRAFSTRLSDYLILSGRGMATAESNIHIEMSVLDEIKEYRQCTRRRNKLC